MATKVYYTVQHRVDGCVHAVLEIRGQELFSTANHPKYSKISLALYKIKGDDIYRTSFHPDGISLKPSFEIKNHQIFFSQKQLDAPVNTQAVFNIR